MKWQVLRMMSAAEGSSVSLDFSTITEWLKILVPALGAWFVAYLANRRDTRRDHLKWESMQQDKLTTGWSEMTAQSREIITRLQVEIARLQNELVDLKVKHQEAIKELESLKVSRQAKKREQ